MQHYEEALVWLKIKRYHVEIVIETLHLVRRNKTFMPRKGSLMNPDAAQNAGRLANRLLAGLAGMIIAHSVKCILRLAPNAARGPRFRFVLVAIALYIVVIALAETTGASLLKTIKEQQCTIKNLVLEKKLLGKLPYAMIR